VLVVAAPVVLPEHFGFEQSAKEFAVEELVAKPAVKTFAVGILPRRAGRDVERRKTPPLDPFLHGKGDELPAPSGAALRAVLRPLAISLRSVQARCRCG